ncbi:MAG: enoyl-CoA hydratase/isomerase family protein [Candidatus Lokiarchaeota archaeon]|nr:enoyl-CoA hydratase/isomerase family protein [Candidatus Lokiarchaeota archaeon]
MDSKVLYNQEGRIGIITLNNPEKGNPIDMETMRGLIDAYKTSAKNNDRIVLYMAKGKHFTVGDNLKEGFEIMTNPGLRSEGIETVLNWQELTSTMLAHPGIIIVGYHGWVIGGGYEHTLWCDFKIAAKSTTFMLPELSMGIFFSNASTKLLPHLVGLNKAKEIMMLGDMFGASEAKELGLVHQVCADEKLEKRMRRLAQKLLEKDELALKRAKEMLLYALDSPLDEVLYKETRIMIETAQSPEAKKRVGEFVKKSKKEGEKKEE